MSSLANLEGLKLTPGIPVGYMRPNGFQQIGLFIGNFEDEYRPNEILNQEVNGKEIKFQITKCFYMRKHMKIIILHETHDDMWNDSEWIYTAQQSGGDITGCG